MWAEVSIERAYEEETRKRAVRREGSIVLYKEERRDEGWVGSMSVREIIAS